MLDNFTISFFFFYQQKLNKFFPLQKEEDGIISLDS